MRHVLSNLALMGVLMMAGPSLAQVPGGGINQSGAVTAGHCMKWKQAGQAQDAGQPCPTSASIASVSFADYAPGATIRSDQTTNLQNFFLYAQRLYYTLKNNSAGLDSQTDWACVQAVVPQQFTISSPLVYPEFVCPTFPLVSPMLASAAIIGAGTATTAYTGDTTSIALANNQQPMVILPPHAQNFGKLSIYATNGTHLVSGIYIGKNWVPASVSRAAACGSSGAGTAYTVNDVLTFAQPSQGPYVATQITINSVNGSGCPLTWTLTTAGSYALPDVLQKYQWTAANGWTGAIAAGSHGQVFDPNIAGAFITSGGTGTGAEFTVTWTPDFAGAGADYYGGATLQQNNWFGEITVLHAGVANDATYGHQFGFACQGLQFNGDLVNPQGGYYGMWLNGCTDFHVSVATPVQAPVLLKIKGSSSVDMPHLVLDTATVHYCEIDNANGVYLAGRIFHNSDANTVTDASCLAGASSSSTASENNNLLFDFTGYNAGAAGGIPFFSCDYTRNSTFRFSIANTDKGGSAVAYPNSLFATFPGTHCESTNSFSGQITGVTTAFGGTLPLKFASTRVALPDATTIGFIRTIRGGFEAAASDSPCVNASATATNTTANLCIVGGVNISSGTSNLAIGQGAMSGNGNSLTGTSNSAIGRGTGNQLTGAATGVTLLGATAGATQTSGSNITYLGRAVGSTVCTTANNNIFIGVDSAITCSAAADTGKFKLGGTGGSLLLGELAQFHLTFGGTAPAAGACGTNPGTPTGTDTAGQIVAGTVSATCVITFNKTYTTAPMCHVQDDTTIQALAGPATTSALTITAAVALGGDTLKWQCFGN